MRFDRRFRGHSEAIPWFIPWPFPGSCLCYALAMSRTFGLMLAAALAAGACSQPATPFSTANARAHLNVLGDTIGSRWIGTPANVRARQYIVSQLQVYGFDVRAEPAIARRPVEGLAAEVTNVVAVKPGPNRDVIAIVSHYDSVADGPGGADDGFGVAVGLEAARVLAAGPLRHTLMILVTDGEEAGLLGAAAAADDPEIGGRIVAYLNLEAVGSSGAALLFETGPGNAWLTRVWARSAPRPRGSSLGIEVYRRLPNDTDFSMFRRRDVPGLNFAITGDGYAYHTDRDRPERVPDGSLAQAGDNTVAIVRALDAMEVPQPSPREATYFDIAGLTAISYGRTAGLVFGLLAIAVGLAGWWRVTREAVRAAGLGRLLLTLAWTILGLAAVAGGLMAAIWALRMVREVYHPWYARPDRLLALLVATGVGSGWAVFRVATFLPHGARGTRHPAIVWCFTLPVWIALAAVSMWLASAAAFLWVMPLAAAGLVTAATPPARTRLLAVTSLVALAAGALFWLRDGYQLFHFVVALFGRLPVVTPLFVYPLLVGAIAAILVPPILAGLAAVHFARRPPVVTASCLLAIVLSGALAYAAPAYTSDRPLRRQARFIQDGLTGRAFWEVGGSEPGIDLGPGSGLDWLPVREAPPTSVPVPRDPLPFVFRAETAAGRVPPARVILTVRARAQDVELAMQLTPLEPGLTVSFALPPGVVPLGANLPGRVGRDERWVATFVAPPSEGLDFRAFLDPSAAATAADAVVVVTSPRLPDRAGDGPGPAWLTTDRTAWRARSVYLWRPAVAVPDELARLW